MGFGGGGGEEEAIGADEAPDVSGERVLFAGFAGFEFTVFGAGAAAVDPCDFERFGGIVFEDDGGFRAVGSGAETAAEGETTGGGFGVVFGEGFEGSVGRVELPAAAEGAGADDAGGVAFDGGERELVRIGVGDTGGAEGGFTTGG